MKVIDLAEVLRKWGEQQARDLDIAGYPEAQPRDYEVVLELTDAVGNVVRGECTEVVEQRAIQRNQCTGGATSRPVLILR